jgi:hypothetical protein
MSRKLDWKEVRSRVAQIHATRARLKDVDDSIREAEEMMVSLSLSTPWVMGPQDLYWSTARQGIFYATPGSLDTDSAVRLLDMSGADRVKLLSALPVLMDQVIAQAERELEGV